MRHADPSVRSLGCNMHILLSMWGSVPDLCSPQALPHLWGGAGAELVEDVVGALRGRDGHHARLLQQVRGYGGASHPPACPTMTSHFKEVSVVPAPFFNVSNTLAINVIIIIFFCQSLACAAIVSGNSGPGISARLDNGETARVALQGLLVAHFWYN